MTEQAKVPAIRFAGFTDPWEQRKFSNLTDRVSMQSSDPDLPQVEYEDIVSGEGTLNKDLRDKEGGKTGIKFYAGDVLYGKLRPYLMNWLYPQFNGVAVGDFWVLRATECDSSFLYRLVQTDSFQRLANVSSGSKMPRADWNLISQSFFAVPADYAEQRVIAKSLAELDDLITLHQRKYDKLVIFKKSMLEKMFPKDGESVPEIRFAGFTDPWEQRKFSDMYEVNNERNTDCELGYDRTLSIATMTFNGGNGAADDSLNSYKVIRVGDIAFEGHANKVHAYGRFVLNDAGDGLMSPRFSCLRPIVEQRYSFWKYYIPHEETMRPILVKATKSGTMMNELVPDDLMRESILAPCLAEQEAIGDCLSQLDSLITLHQRKLELLQNIKKSLLDKMFV
ncbi:Type I restriction modification DNA specificity d omain protein [Bifidobacterium breve]|uniref:Type I restriction modification DNA specificity d omain protein n=1 Tax=Bifidobacterium breve TaxID=1685 RepID=A0ABD7VPS9_BIFBR|nr:Type I restriction modification DNA specificity d omain protein [Bifidobacterium breve]VWQ14462.1 Type+I+restriction+modification+DNA+specificity+domain+protein [Bifidobacterium breve]